MKTALPSAGVRIGPATGACASKVQRTVPPEESFSVEAPDACDAVPPFGVDVAVGVAVGVSVGQAGQDADGVPTDTVIGCPLMPPELTLMHAHPLFSPVYWPPLLVDGGWSTCGPPTGLLFAVHNVLGAFVMSASVVCLPLTRTPCALKLIDTPLPLTPVLVACGQAVGGGVGPEVFVGVGVGGGGPGQMLIAVRANPGDGLAVGHSPAMKKPCALKLPKHPPPPPQLAIRVPSTNIATGATTSHNFHRNIEP